MHIDDRYNRVSHRSESKKGRPRNNTNRGQRQGGVGGEVVGELAPVREAGCMDSKERKEMRLSGGEMSHLFWSMFNSSIRMFMTRCSTKARSL